MVSKKVLIISYFFPPCNLTASQRTYNWGKYFKEFGYDPIIITRKWDYPINTPSDIGKSSRSMDIEVLVNEKYKVYNMPYKSSLKDRIFEKNIERYKFVRLYREEGVKLSLVCRFFNCIFLARYIERLET